MGWRGTTALMLLLALVGAYLWFEEAPQKQPDSVSTLLGEPRSTEPTQTLKPLFDFTPSEVTGIRLEQEGTVRQTERNTDTWQGVADSHLVDDFLENLIGLGVLMDIPAEPGDLQDYGLQPPHSVLQFQLRGRPEPLVLLIGDRNPATTGVYVRLGENGNVVLAGALVAWEFEKAFRALAPPGANT